MPESFAELAFFKKMFNTSDNRNEIIERARKQAREFPNIGVVNTLTLLDIPPCSKSPSARNTRQETCEVVSCGKK
jgi:hypothetical protein